MSKTITRKKSKQKEIDPKFGVSEWDPAELDVRQTRHATYESRPPPRGGTWRDQIKEEAYKLRQRQREADSPEFISPHSTTDTMDTDEAQEINKQIIEKMEKEPEGSEYLNIVGEGKYENVGETLDTGATFSTVTEMQAEVEKDQQAYEEIESLEDSHIVSFPKLVCSLETCDATYEPTPAKAPVPTTPDIIGSTFTETRNDRTEIVTTESAGPPHVAPDDPAVTSHSRAANTSNLVRVITENVELHQVTPSKTSTIEDTSRPKTSLPGIGVFLDKSCTIPLVRCDFDTIKATVESREEIAEPVNSKNKHSSNNPTLSADPVLPTTRTSARKRTVINYKDFLEEFADLPPSPPKRKREVDLKRRPSKSRMAAEKYRKSDFATKPLNVPKPVRRKVNTPKNTPGTSTNISKCVSSKQETITKPATTQETEDAIEALLLLGTMGRPSSQSENDGADNELLMPIGVNLTTDSNIDIDIDAAPHKIPTHPPKVDTGMDAAIEKDTGGEPSVVPDQEPQEKDAENKQNDPKPPIQEDDGNKGNRKKTFVTRQFGLKRRSRPKRKFKCEKCAQELETVRDYNQHYLDKHPPTPCPDCQRQFISPRTMAKHRYSHAETMYECETCGQGFTFRSQYLSHRKVHLTIQGFVCFKAKCGQRFKRESELNAHLKAHDSTPIKCEHCDYTNKDQRNLRAHMRIHSEKLPFFCILCGKRFRWQEQKRRHIPNCTG